MFWDKKGIKESKNTYLVLFLTEVDYETLIELKESKNTYLASFLTEVDYETLTELTLDE